MKFCKKDSQISGIAGRYKDYLEAVYSQKKLNRIRIKRRDMYCVTCCESKLNFKNKLLIYEILFI